MRVSLPSGSSQVIEETCFLCFSSPHTIAFTTPLFQVQLVVLCFQICTFGGSSICACFCLGQYSQRVRIGPDQLGVDLLLVFMYCLLVLLLPDFFSMTWKLRPLKSYPPALTISSLADPLSRFSNFECKFHLLHVTHWLAGLYNSNSSILASYS